VRVLITFFGCLPVGFPVAEGSVTPSDAVCSNAKVIEHKANLIKEQNVIFFPSAIIQRKQMRTYNENYMEKSVHLSFFSSMFLSLIYLLF